MAVEDEIVQVVSDLLAHSPAAGLTAAGGYIYAQLAHPSVKATGQVFAHAHETRLRRWLKLGLDAQRMTPEAHRSDPASERVLARSVGEATLFSERVQQTYAAGVLASSRRDAGGDDRGVAFLSMLEAMPSSHVRLHYALYSSMRDSMLASAVSEAEAWAGRWVLPMDVLAEIVPDDGASKWAISDAMSTLASHQLVHLMPATGGAPVFAPALLGVSLFTWAHGAAQTGLDLSDQAFPTQAFDGPRFSRSSERFVRLDPTGGYALDLRP